MIIHLLAVEDINKCEDIKMAVLAVDVSIFNIKLPELVWACDDFIGADFPVCFYFFLISRK